MSWEYDDATESLGVQILEEFVERSQPYMHQVNRHIEYICMNRLAWQRDRTAYHLETNPEKIRDRKKASYEKHKTRLRAEARERARAKFGWHSNAENSKRSRAKISKDPARKFLTDEATKVRSARRIERIRTTDELRAKKNEQNRQYYQRKKAAKGQ